MLVSVKIKYFFMFEDFFLLLFNLPNKIEVFSKIILRAFFGFITSHNSLCYWFLFYLKISKLLKFNNNYSVSGVN